MKSKTLTRQEILITNLLMADFSSEEITEKLFISIETFHTHLDHIFNKLKIPKCGNRKLRRKLLKDVIEEAGK